MHTFSFRTLLAIILLIQACKKDNNETPGPTGDPVSRELVRSIDWNNGTKAIMEYATDSSLKKIVYTFQNISSATVFNWADKKLKEMYDDRSWYKNVFYYNGTKVSHYINSAAIVSLPGSYKMEYAYNDDGFLASLKHYTTNEAGTELKATSTYQYNAAGQLAKVVTQSGNSIFTHTIERYSDQADFDPLVFMEPSLSENYTIFNFPVLSRLKNFPEKIIRKVKTGGAEEYIDKIEESTCEIANKRLNKITTSVTIPGMPQYSNTITAVFNY